MYKGHMHQGNPSHIEVILPSLRSGVPIGEIKNVAAQVAAQTEWIESLIVFLCNPKTSTITQVRKGAWVLNHAFQIDERPFFKYRGQLGQLLNELEDFSALREVLKLLAHPIWLDVETETERREFLELGWSMIHLDDVPVAIYYACMQIMQSRSTCISDYQESLESLRQLRHRSEVNSPLYRCVHRYEQRFNQKLTRVNLGN